MNTIRDAFPLHGGDKVGLHARTPLGPGRLGRCKDSGGVSATLKRLGSTYGALVPASVVLAGCASVLVSASGVLSEEQAPAYAGLAPFEFVKRRFFDEEQTKVLDSIENATRGFANAVDRLSGRRPGATADSPRKPEVRAGTTTVTWPAYFTDTNYVQLVRPTAELRRYCKAQSGQWKVLEPYLDDPLVTLRRDPVEAFLDAQARVMRNLRSRGAFVGFEELRDVVASDVGTQMAEEAAQRNRRVQSLFSAEGFRYAQRLDAFGLFACKQSEGSGWLASVLPATLIARDGSNQLDSSMARLAIRTYDSLKPRLPAS